MFEPGESTVLGYHGGMEGASLKMLLSGRSRFSGIVFLVECSLESSQCGHAQSTGKNRSQGELVRYTSRPLKTGLQRLGCDIVLESDKIALTDVFGYTICHFRVTDRRSNKRYSRMTSYAFCRIQGIRTHQV